VVIGDVDGDGFPDIVTSQEGSGYYYSPALALSSFSTTQVLAYDRNLNPIRSWQLTAGNGCDLFAFPGLAIGNFDHDGFTDIAVAHTGWACPEPLAGFASMITYACAVPSDSETTGRLLPQ